MTISNSNLLSILPVNPDVPLDSLIAGQAGAQSMDITDFDQPLLDGDFWAMLNQQLAAISVDKEVANVDDKHLKTLLDGLNVVAADTLSDAEAEVDFTVSFNPVVAAEQDVIEIEKNLTPDWMHRMKSHFVEPEIEQSEALYDGLAPIAETVDGMQASIIAAPVLSELVAASLSQNGDKLPSARQTVSSILPAQISPIAELQTKPVNTKIAEPVDLEFLRPEKGDKLSFSQFAETELKKLDMPDAEKLHNKPLVMDNTGPVIKENAPVVLAPLNQPMAVTPQNPANPPLSAASQTLQLSPQASATQWGEALGERVSLLLNKQLNIAEIRIDPPHLGKLDIQIQLKDDSATILINTQHAQTRDLIDAASIRLKEFLQEAGYNSVDVDVSHQQQSMAQDDLSQQQDNEHNDNAAHPQQSTQNELSETNLSELNLNVDNGRIDYFA